MSDRLSKDMPLRDFGLWKKYDQPEKLYSFDIELTARCNLDCRHCYINQPAGDAASAATELSAAEIARIADEAIALGAIWCLITGGEPLLRKDFAEIYLMLKRKGLLLSVFTNAVLINEAHVQLFEKYPPRDIEITVYGATAETYERVTRRPGSFAAFQRGLRMLQEAGVRVRLKAMALRSNVHEMAQIAEFCRAHTKDFFRYDANLHLRFDRDPARNEEIRGERLPAAEVVRLEQENSERSEALPDFCEKYVRPEFEHMTSRRVFHCGVGNGSAVIGHDGRLRLCSTLYHPEYMFDLRQGSLLQGLQQLVPKAQSLTTERESFLTHCRTCRVINLCQWCAAESYLETGELDRHVPSFCRVAYAREEAVNVQQA